METPLLAVDAIIFYRDGLVLIERENPPYQGCYALPGGFVTVGETVESAVQREAIEETGLEIELCGLVGIYSAPGRDPRGHIVSIAYTAKGIGNLKSGSDARSAKIFPVDRLPILAFDHDQIIRDALKNTKASRTITLK